MPWEVRRARSSLSSWVGGEVGGWEGLAAASRIVLARYGPRIDTYESVLFNVRGRRERRGVLRYIRVYTW